MRCPKCSYNNLDGSAVCNLCGLLLHQMGKNYYRSPAAPKPQQPPPPAPGGGALHAASPGPDVMELLHCIVCFPLDPVKLDRNKVYEIGRSRDCTIILPVGMVSRHHARIQWRRGGFTVSDLKSANGTFVNGESVADHFLRNRDQIKIGPYLLDYFVYSGDTEIVTSRDREMESTKDITIGDPTKNINTFRGSIADMALGEIMQLLNITRKSGNLVVAAPGLEGTLYFRGGEIVHAAAGDRTGETAVGGIMRVREGSFVFSLDDSVQPHTVPQKTSKIIVEALRFARMPLA